MGFNIWCLFGLKKFKMHPFRVRIDLNCFAIDLPTEIDVGCHFKTPFMILSLNKMALFTHIILVKWATLVLLPWFQTALYLPMVARLLDPPTSCISMELIKWKDSGLWGWGSVKGEVGVCRVGR